MGCCASQEEPAENVNDSGDGPKVRTCTDVFMLVIFIAFWFVMILIAAFALVFGNPKRLIHGYDSFGNICGSENEPIGDLQLSGLDMRAKPYLFYMDVTNISKSLKICVTQCPNTTLSNMNELKLWYNKTGSDLCSYNDKTRDVPDEKLASSAWGPCPVFPVYDSIVILRRCIPRAVKEVLQASVVAVLNSWDTVEQVLADLYSTWPELIIFCFVAFLVSLLVVATLHYLASVVAWIFMIVITIASLGCTGVLWWTWATLKWELKEKQFAQWLTRMGHNEQAFLTFSIIATVLTVILLLLVIVMRKHVGFVADVFKEAAKCLADVPALFIQPIITFLILLLFFAFWVTVAVCLATSNYPGKDELKPYADMQLAATMPHSTAGPNEANIEARGNYSVSSLKDHKSFTLVHYVDPSWVKYMWWFLLIGLIWTSEFILACQQMVIAGAVASWYFKKDKSSNEWPVLQAIRRLFCYHTGSVALGSFLITLFKVPRLILMYLTAKAQAKETPECTKTCLKCCTCFFYCLECFIRFMNHNAYTVIAMQGHGFCTSARIAFSTISDNVIRFTTLNSVGDFILFLGKVIVTLITTILAVLYLKRNEDLHLFAVPVLLVAVFSFLIAHAIISLYEGVVDTLFLCLCEDSRINKEEGKWRESALVAPESAGSPQELTPINE